MRRLLACIGVSVALAAAPTVLGAGTPRYHGRIAGDAAIRFKAVVRHGEIVKVRGILWRRLPIHCNQGRFRFRGDFDGDAFPVNDSEFRASGTGGGTTYVSHARVVGRFTKHGRRAHGTVRVRGGLDAHHTDCHSGIRRWWAHRLR
jgi:hypothetical protein